MAKVIMPLRETESVKIDKKVVNRVRKYVQDTRQTIGGFISIEINSILDKLQPEKKNPNE